ncbi:MAG: efflux RND transporter periplasmic adaptor subunit [Fibrobacter sp.]|nr:efflux RND transporter periplasmic adaptor subunit [Fibrobacter sp.]
MKKLLKILVVLLVLAAIAVGVKFFFFRNSAASEVGVPVSAPVTKLTLSTVISATGTLEPVDQVEVGTQVSGDIAEIFVDFNSKVKKGQVIAELDKSKLQSTLNQAEIALHSAEIDYQYKANTYQRILALSQSNSASAVDLEQAEYNMNAAKYALERSQNDVAQAKLNLSYATIKSPIDGVVLKRAVDVGQTVAASMSTPTLFVIAKDLKQMKVMADVDEADIGSVKKGQKVTFTVDAFQNETFTGKVQEVRLSPTTTSNVVTYTVVINAKNPKLKLLPGMTATCTIVTKEVKNALTVPVKALKFNPAGGTAFAKPEGLPPPPDAAAGGFPGASQKGAKKGTNRPTKQDGDKVWINLNGKLVSHPVTTGLNDGVNVQILAGLELGDSVVVGQEVLSRTEASKTSGGSPFMPSPPGKKKK